MYRGFQRIRQGSDGGEAAEEEAQGRGLRYFGVSGQYRLSEMAVSEGEILLQMPVSSIQADIIVSQDGNDTYKTIKNSPQYSTRRTIIYVKAER